jgi:serine protease Do
MRNIAHPSSRLLLLSFAVCGIACQGHAATPARPLSSETIFTQSRPSVVLVHAQFSSQVMIPSPAMSPDQQTALQRAIDAKAAAGSLDRTDAQAVLVATLEETAANIFSYFSPSPDPSRLRQLPAAVTMTSSGFIVSRDGAVATNAHVVAMSADVLGALMLRQAVEAFVPFMSGIPTSVPAETRQRLADAQVRWATKYAQVGVIETSLIVFTGPSIAGPVKASQGTVASLVKAGSAAREGDVAVIRLAGRRTWPAIPLGSDSGLHVGDRIYVIGYPAPASLDQPLTPDASFVSRMAPGLVSGRTSMTGGGSSIATDAATTPGDSGGPMIDSSGKVVGLLSSGSIDPATGQAVQGPGVGVPVSSVRAVLTAAGVRLS